MALGQDKPSRTYPVARFILELDGVDCGVLNSVDGGHFKSEAIGQQVGSEGLVTRYPGRQKFDEIVIQAGASMSAPFWQWIADSIATKPSRKNGAIIACDFDGKERTRRTFMNALISEITFPGCDAKAKSPAFVSVKIAPEVMTWEEKEGKKVGGVSPGKQKMWVPANYQFHLDRLPKEITVHTTKIEALTIKQNIINNPIGKFNVAQIEAGRVEHPNLTVYVPERYVKSYYDWWKMFVGDMQHDPGNETTGAITYLASDCKTELMTLNFKGIGIMNLTFDKHEGSGDPIKNVKVDMYMESMSFKAGAGVGA